jgi:copper chaperone
MKLEGESITQETIKVEGMSCGHCEMRVKKAVEAIDGVRKVEVNLRNKNAVVEYDERKANLEKIKAAIREVGYEPV